MTQSYDDDQQVKVERAVNYLIADVKDVCGLFDDAFTRPFIVRERADISLAISRLEKLRREILAAIQPSDEKAA